MSQQNACYDCIHRRDIPGDCHSSCVNVAAHIKANFHGIRNGWFCWPFNFDPVWLESCDGFEAKAGYGHAKDDAQQAEANPN